MTASDKEIPPNTADEGGTITEVGMAGESAGEEHKNALDYHMYLKEKQDGRIKVRSCTDGQKQCLYKSKDEMSHCQYLRMMPSHDDQHSGSFYACQY